MHADRLEKPICIRSFDASVVNSLKKALLSSICNHRYILGAAMSALLPSAQALAQCAPPPAPVSISSGNCADPALTARDSNGPEHVVEASGTGTYSGTSINLTANGSGYGMYATDGGEITVIGTSVDGAGVSTYGTGSHGLYADDGGVIAGTYTSVVTTGADAYGIGAAGMGTIITLTDGDVYTWLDNAHGAYAANGGTITLTRTGVMTSGVGASAVFADAGGSITLNNLSTFSYGDNTPGAVASGAGSSLTLNSTYVNIDGNGSAGLFAAGGGMITISGGAIATGEYYGGTVIANSPGMLARGAGSSIQAGNGATSATYGANSPGVWADAGGRIDFSGYGIFTYQPNSSGAVASGADSTVTLTDTIVRTSGPSSAGLLVTDAGTMIVTDTEVTTGYGMTGSTPPALQFPDIEIGLEAHGADVVGVGSRLQAENGSITTNGDDAVGVRVSQGGTASIIGGDITTTGSAAHGIVGIDGGTLTVTGTSVTAQGGGSSAIYLAGSAPSVVSVAGGSLSAASGAIVHAEGGTGTVSISGGTAITPAVVNGRLLLAQVTEDALGNPADLTLNIDGISALTGDIVVDPSTLTYNLSNSAWTGDLVLSGPGNTASASLVASQWTGDLVADLGNAANTFLSASQWTGRATNAADIKVDRSSVWRVTGDSNATGTLTNAGQIRFEPLASGFSTLTTHDYVGEGGTIVFNTFLGDENSPTNLLVIDGGTASGATKLSITNAGGSGAHTSQDGIRLVEAIKGGTTDPKAFSLARRVVAGAYEYRLFRGGASGAEDWFLRSWLIPSGPVNPTPDPGPGPGPGPDPDPTPDPGPGPGPGPTPDPGPGPDPMPDPDPIVPLYRPEAPLYAPIPAMARHMGLVTLGTLHERVGEEMNIRDLAGSGTVANGAWARLIGERGESGWAGSVDARVRDAHLVGVQAGFDIYRAEYDNGHRDHVGLYGAYTDYRSSSVSGFALGERDLLVGGLTLNGPAAGAYWTHFGPSGWYLDAVVQGNWFDARATSRYDAQLNTRGTGFAASLEGGYPTQLSERWQIEPQAQIVYQTVSVNGSEDTYSTVGWNAGDAVTGRIGARLQYTVENGATLWQPYAKANLWHGFRGTDQVSFGSSPAIENRLGNTSLELGVGVTARINRGTSLYGYVDHHWSVSGEERSAATQGAAGIRFNW